MKHQGLALSTKVATLYLVILVSHLESCSRRTSYVIDHMAAPDKALIEGALQSSVSEFGSRTNAAPCIWAMHFSGNLGRSHLPMHL